MCIREDDNDLPVDCHLLIVTVRVLVIQGMFSSQLSFKIKDYWRENDSFSSLFLTLKIL